MIIYEQGDTISGITQKVPSTLWSEGYEPQVRVKAFLNCPVSDNGLEQKETILLPKCSLVKGASGKSSMVLAYSIKSCRLLLTEKKLEFINWDILRRHIQTPH